jgi:peptide deformylase
MTNSITDDANPMVEAMPLLQDYPLDLVARLPVLDDGQAHYHPKARTILKFPDSRLKQVAEPVDNITDCVVKLVADMFHTLRVSGGIGLAAPQVGVGLRIVTIDTSEQRNRPLCLINPKIVETQGEAPKDYKEGCLSVPNIFESVSHKRAAYVRVQALNIHGSYFDVEGRGLFALCLQHEIDHLNGILFIDHLSRFKLQRARDRSRKYR